jgi:hypothetical protein
MISFHQEEYSPLRETFMHTGDVRALLLASLCLIVLIVSCLQGFVLVYSIDQDETLEDLRGIHEQILAVHANKSVPMIVVANKSDLENDRAGVYVNRSSKRTGSNLPPR